jgi:hypothetical protein
MPNTVPAKNKDQTMMENARRIFKNMDMFGYPISFTHKGQSNYKSNFGASITVFQFLLIMGFMANEIVGVLDR